MTTAPRDTAWGGSGGGSPPTIPPVYSLDDFDVAGDMLVRGGSPWSSVDAAGATGDGVADDTAYFVDAATRVPTGGEIRLGPGKTYKLTSSDLLPVMAQKGLSIQGAGIDSSKILYSGSGYAFQLGDGGATDSRNQYIRDCTIDASASSTPSGLVTFKGTRFCGLERVRVVGPTGGSKVLVYFDPGDGTIANYFNVLDRCQLLGQTQASDVLLKLYSTTANGANSNYISRNWFGVANQSILIDGGDTNVIGPDNEFNGSTNTAIRLQSTGTTYNKIIGNQFDGPTTAVDVATLVANAIIDRNTGGGLITVSGTAVSIWIGDNPGLVPTASGNAYTQYPVAVASSGTIAIPDGAKALNVTGTATITAITGGRAGRPVTLIFSGAAATTGVVDGGTLFLNGNFVYTPNDTLTLVATDDNNWYEVARSVN